MRHRFLGDQERAGDLLGRQTAERPQSQGDLRVRRKSGMATGEHEFQSFVSENRFIHGVFLDFLHIKLSRLFGQRAVAADAVDRSVASSGHQPSPLV